MKFYKIAFLIISSCMLFQCNGKGGRKEAHGSQISDSERFALEYPLVGGDNIFIYKNADETADILAKGRGIVFIGFKECPWCQVYAVYLHDVASEMAIDKIYYCDIRKDRENNSESYKKITGVLAGHLQYDDEGRQKVYVPDVSIVSRGRIIARDFETSKETSGCNTPQEYWNDDRVNALKERLRTGINILIQIISRPCNTC
jgi:predicted bacteriocin transport accessory protein